MVVSEQSGGKEASTLRQEHAAFQEQNRLLQAEVIALRQQAHYYRTQHERAVQRAQELQAQVDVLKAKVAELQKRLFGRKSERVRRATPLGATGESGVGPRARGQQPGRAGHGRKLRENLPVVEDVLDLCEEQKRCPRCGLAGESFRQPHTSEQIEWEVRLFRRRTIRPKYRRPSGCHCQPERPDIVSAPLAPALIPKGILAPSAGTLCGALEKLTPLFDPLYEAIQAQS